ncbi:MAG: TRAP transporter small permease subunit [Pseudomonadota bacterium]|nr:TRAP transporter small permease subunit [Pseudomonadota bacterium]
MNPALIFTLTLRFAALSMAAIALIFTLNNYLIFWQGWPGLAGLFTHFSWLGSQLLGDPLTTSDLSLGLIQFGLYLGAVVTAASFLILRPERTLTDDADLLAGSAAFIARAAFWMVLLVGIADMAISFMRVEDLLSRVVGEHLSTQLGRPNYRGNYIHYPLIGIAVVIACFSRSLGFTWLALLIVLAEFQIVLSRFIFSYEQAFMGDLVRFWYAALFLFASAYTLIEEGHVRVDIIYAGMGKRLKAWSNTIGSLLLGVPLCWIIITSGMWDKTNLINAPLLSFEVTQSGYGLYVKYLMAGFLLVYALTMMMQFLGYTLRNVAVLVDDPEAHSVASAHAD